MGFPWILDLFIFSVATNDQTTNKPHMNYYFFLFQMITRAHLSKNLDPKSFLSTD